MCKTPFPIAEDFDHPLPYSDAKRSRKETIDGAGDGAETATVFAQSIVHAGDEYLAAGMNRWVEARHRHDVYKLIKNNLFHIHLLEKKMKNKQKDKQVTELTKRPGMLFRTLPIVAAMAASGIIQPAFAVDHTWFGGTGDWGLNTNWSPASVPGASDKAIINSGNATLSFNSGVAALDFFGGSLLGAGNLGDQRLDLLHQGTDRR